MKRNKKSWFKGLVITGVFAISALSLSLNAQTGESVGPDEITPQGGNGAVYHGYSGDYCWTSPSPTGCVASY